MTNSTQAASAFNALLISHMACFFDTLVRRTPKATQRVRHALIEKVLRAAWATRDSRQPGMTVIGWLDGLLEAAVEGTERVEWTQKKRCTCYLTERYECPRANMPRVADQPRRYVEW